MFITNYKFEIIKNIIEIFLCTLIYAPAVGIAVVGLPLISCIAACKLCLYQV